MSRADSSEPERDQGQALHYRSTIASPVFDPSVLRRVSTVSAVLRAIAGFVLVQGVCALAFVLVFDDGALVRWMWAIVTTLSCAYLRLLDDHCVDYGRQCQRARAVCAARGERASLDAIEEALRSRLARWWWPRRDFEAASRVYVALRDRVAGCSEVRWPGDAALNTAVWDWTGIRLCLQTVQAVPSVDGEVHQLSGALRIGPTVCIVQSAPR